jgi:hypothetical protein
MYKDRFSPKPLSSEPYIPFVLAYKLFPIAASSAWTWKTPSTPFPAGVSLHICTRIPTCILLSRWLRCYIHGTERCIISTPKMLRSCTARFNLVRASDKEILLARFCSTWRTTPPLRIIGERCKDSSSILAFFGDGEYLIKTPFVPTMITVATEELGIPARGFNQSSLHAWYLRIQPMKLLR